MVFFCRADSHTEEVVQLSIRSRVIKAYGRTHTVAETAALIIRLLGLDTPKDDHGHWYKEAGAPCPHDNGMASLSEDQRKQAVKIVKALTGKNPKVNRKSQNQHINAKSAREATEKERNLKPGINVIHKSYFTAKWQTVDAMVRDRIKKGKYKVMPGQYGTIHLLVDVEKPIGVYYNKNEEKQRSTMVRVDFSEEDGYHLFPTRS